MLSLSLTLPDSRLWAACLSTLVERLSETNSSGKPLGCFLRIKARTLCLGVNSCCCGNSVGACRNSVQAACGHVWAHRSCCVCVVRLFPVGDHHSEDVICGITGTGSDGLQATSCAKRPFICPPPPPRPTLPLPPASESQDALPQRPTTSGQEAQVVLMSPRVRDFRG